MSAQVIQLDEKRKPAMPDGGGVVVAQADTPINRATIRQLTINEMEMQLEAIRLRRLTLVNKAQEAAKARQIATVESLVAKFDDSVLKVRDMIEKLIAREEKCAVAINKLRAMAIEIAG